MIGPLVQFRSHLLEPDRRALDDSHILTSVIRGFVSSLTIAANSAPIRTTPSNLPSSLTLISRLSSRRAGTRFNSRGVDDDGNVANFIESETVFCCSSGLCFSYTQCRGSVPIFWEQQATGLLPQQQKIQITRSVEATQPAFDRHFQELELRYGTIHVLNLLSALKSGESQLTARYDYHIQQCSVNQRSVREEKSQHAQLRRSLFDFEAESKDIGYEAGKRVKGLINEQADGFAFFVADATGPSTASKLPNVILEQSGIFRTNCLDCLDRTNLIQTVISQMVLESFFAQQNASMHSGSFWVRHSALWADNGDVRTALDPSSCLAMLINRRHFRRSTPERVH